MLHNEGKLSSGMSINMSQLACLSLIFKYHSMPAIVVYLKCLYQVHRMNIKINHCTASPRQVRRMSRSVNLPWSKRAWRDLKYFNMIPNSTRPWQQKFHEIAHAHSWSILCLRRHLGNAGLLAQNNLVFIFAIIKSSFLFIIHRQSLRSKVYNCRVFYSLTMSSPDSGMLDEILDVTKASLNESNSQNLTRKGTTLTGSSSKQQPTSIANMSQATDSTDSTKGEGEATVLHKLDLLTSLVQDMVPVVKTLQEAHDASLLQDVDDADDPPLSDSENEEDPPTKRPRTESQLDKQPSSKTTGNQPPLLLER